MQVTIRGATGLFIISKQLLIVDTLFYQVCFTPCDNHGWEKGGPEINVNECERDTGVTCSEKSFLETTKLCQKLMELMFCGVMSTGNTMTWG